ncbi:RNA-binding region RNP-1 domain-containing protein [Tieghemostelium lacteum]|uniref:RNA-binding region RNP-1 domain-containing protein n=1 Tax=Tieghemostelium lacteum TaxID=361077 RepID=A0A152A202_TIELA|nr:RNA-binding region RNP-1 domain-containing protein [Tieghemostelium lacteum]|eukprot:KYR00147.1 RNA-binding region RNP-1 domain-containing protein [Tieghemostelium lacteum]
MDTNPGEYGIFISDIARGVTDEQLKEEFSKIGEVAEAVVVKNKHSGETKGYGFVKFYSLNDAYAAIESTNPPTFKDSVSGKSQSVKITLADSKNTIYIGHIPKGLTESEIKIELEEISGCTLKSFELDTSNKFYGYAFFKDHDTTIKAIKAIQKSHYTASLTPANNKDKDKPTSVTKVLFVRGIKSQIEGDQLRKQLGVDLIEKIIVPLDQQKNVPIGHAFIYCNSPNDAKTIMQHHHTVDFQGRTITITWGLPKHRGRDIHTPYYGAVGAYGPSAADGYPYFYPPSAYDYYYGPHPFPGGHGPFIDPRRSGYGGSGSEGKFDTHGPKRPVDYYSMIPPPPPRVPPHGKPYGYGHDIYSPPSRDFKPSASSSSKAPPSKYRYNPY